MNMNATFEKFEVLRARQEETNRLREELTEWLRETFTQPCDFKEVEVQYTGKVAEDSKEMKVVYPVLRYPEGFTRKQESFTRERSNEVIHEYIMTYKNEHDIHVREVAVFKSIIDDEEKGMIITNFYMTEEVKYEVTISGVQETFCRTFEYKDVLNQIMKDKVLKYCTHNNIFEKEYENSEARYEAYLNVLGKNSDYITLKDLKEHHVKRMYVTNAIYAIIEVTQLPKRTTLWLENAEVKIAVKNKKVVKNSIKITVFLNSEELNTRTFEYYEMPKMEKYKNEVTLEEAISLIS